VSTVILGASKLSQLKENLSSIEDIEMVNESVMERIHTILDNTPESPLF
jgi:aryl-alcohol dehydrogenase-like predicted oxidoreductase